MRYFSFKCIIILLSLILDGSSVLAFNRIGFHSIEGVEKEYIVLSKEIPLGEQLSQSNVIYEIRFEYDLGGKTVWVPNDCVLKFDGGKISNGTIVNCGIIENEKDQKIFKDIVFKSPKEQVVKLFWFNYISDSDALANAAKFKHVDCTGKWVIDKPVEINNDINLVNGYFLCQYGMYNITIVQNDLKEVVYKKRIKAGVKELPIKLGIIDVEAVLINSKDIYYKTERSDYRNGTCGEIMTLKSIKRKKVLFDTQEGTVCEYNNDIKLSFFKPLNVTLRGCSFYSDYKDKSDKGGVLVGIGKAKAEVTNCTFSGCSVGLALGDCIYSEVRACKFENIYPWAAAFTGGTCNSTVTECLFDTNRHGWTTLGEVGVVKNCEVSNNVCHNSLLAICPHANAYGITISNNTVDGSQGGVGSFAPCVTIVNNKITNLNGFPAIYLTEAGGINPTVKDNIIENCKGYGGAIRNDDVDLTSDISYIKPEYCVIQDNEIVNCPDFSGITCDYSRAGVSFPVNVTNNTIKDIGYTAVLVKSSSATVTGNKIQRVLRSNYTPVSVQSTSTTVKSKNAIVVDNTVSLCNGENEFEVKGFDNVVFHSNGNTSSKNIKVKFDECRRIKRDNIWINE